MQMFTHLKKGIALVPWNVVLVFWITSLHLNAQILTKEDLRREITKFEAASLQAEPPSMPALQAGRIWSHLATLYQDAGMFGKSEHAFEHAMQLLTIAPVSKPDLAAVMDNQGTLYMETGNTKEAERAELRASKMREEAGLQSGLPVSWYHLATLYLQEHRSGKAKEFAERSVIAFSADANAVPEEKIGSLLVLGSALRQSHQYLEAIAKLQIAYQVANQAYGPDKFPTGFSAFLLGYAQWKNGDLSSAGELMQRGAEIMGKELGWEHPAYLSIMAHYAQFLRDVHQQDHAQSIEKQIKKMRAQLNSNPAYDHSSQTISIMAFF